MKSYVIGALALLTLSLSCCSGDSSSEQQLIEEMTRIPMTFAVSQESDTRLSDIDYINNTRSLSSFYLWSQVDGNDYLKDKFTKSGDSYLADNLSAAELVWPGIDNTTVDFYATNHLNFGSISTISNHSIIVENNAVRNSDLLFAYTQTTHTPADGVVHLKFNHAMAELGILMKRESNNPDVSCIVKNIVLKGKSSKIYNFKTDSWSENTASTTEDITYFEASSTVVGYYLSYGEDFKELIEASETAGKTFEFLIPGEYTIVVTYGCSMPGSTTVFVDKTCKVELKQGEKNRVYLTLPDVVTTNP